MEEKVDIKRQTWNAEKRLWFGLLIQFPLITYVLGQVVAGTFTRKYYFVLKAAALENQKT